MKVPAVLGVLATTAALAFVASPSVAQPYRGYGYYEPDPCQAKQHDSGTHGAIIGGLAGALLGSSVAPHHGNRAGGAAIGAVAGAVLGNNIARSSARSSETCRERDYADAYYGYQTPYVRGGYYSGHSRYDWDRVYAEPAPPPYSSYGYAPDDDDDDDD